MKGEELAFDHSNLLTSSIQNTNIRVPQLNQLITTLESYPTIQG